MTRLILIAVSILMSTGASHGASVVWSEGHGSPRVDLIHPASDVVVQYGLSVAHHAPVGAGFSLHDLRKKVGSAGVIRVRARTERGLYAISRLHPNVFYYGIDIPYLPREFDADLTLDNGVVLEGVPIFLSAELELIGGRNRIDLREGNRYRNEAVVFGRTISLFYWCESTKESGPLERVELLLARPEGPSGGMIVLADAHLHQETQWAGFGARWSPFPATQTVEGGLFTLRCTTRSGKVLENTREIVPTDEYRREVGPLFYKATDK